MLKPGHKSNENDCSTCISGEGSGWEHGEGVSQFYMEVDASVVLRITGDTPIDTIVLGIEAEAPHNTFDVRPLPAKMPTARFLEYSDCVERCLPSPRSPTTSL